MAYVAIFEGLVVDQADQVVEVTYLGSEPYYVVNDAGFRRHIPSEKVDRQVLRAMQEQVMAQRSTVVEGMLQFVGQDDLFTQAMIETSIDKLDENMEQLLQVGLPEDARVLLGAMGFHIVIDVHGEVVDLQLPAQIEPEE